MACVALVRRRITDGSRINIPVVIDPGLSPEQADVAREVAEVRAQQVAWKVLKRQYGRSREWLRQMMACLARITPDGANDG